MKSLIIIIALAVGLIFCNNLNAQSVSTVKYQSDADVKVYQTTDSAAADLVVFQTETPGSNSNNGVWYFANFSSDAHKRIFFVNAAADADLVIYYTSNQSSAGWRNSSKSGLME